MMKQDAIMQGESPHTEAKLDNLYEEKSLKGSQKKDLLLHSTPFNTLLNTKENWILNRYSKLFWNKLILFYLP